MTAYTKPQQWKNEESKRLRGEGDKSSLLLSDFKEGKLRDLRKEEGGSVVIG